MSILLSLVSDFGWSYKRKSENGEYGIAIHATHLYIVITNKPLLKVILKAEELE